MTLPFNEEIINEGIINTENFKYPNFVGFLNPNGIPISFKDKFGYTGHGEEPSLQERFRVYYILKIKDSKLMSPLEKYIMTNEYQYSEKERYINYLRQLKKSLNEELKQRKKNEYSFSLEPKKQMELDIYNFFLDCYSAKTFFDGVGKIETCMCEREFWEKEYKNKNLYNIYHNDFKLEYGIYKDKILVDIFKNIIIQYLGYHSVERVPKTISTSSFRIYETFYNYLLNDYTIFQIPKMIFDDRNKKYIQQNQNEFFLPKSELRLKNEIQAIKKLVPLNERTKYYR